MALQLQFQPNLAERARLHAQLAFISDLEPLMNIPLFTRDDLGRLIASEGGPHLSLFLPPPNALNNTLEEEKTRFGNLQRAAHGMLSKHWMPDAEASEFLRPLETLSQELLQLNPRRQGVAIFLGSQSFDVFRINHELDEQLNIARTFKIRPVLACLDEPDPYVVLTLSQHRLALFASSPEGLARVAGVMPESFEKIEAELTVEPQTQARVAAVGGRGGQGVVFHGQGGKRDVEKVDLENYLKHVDNSTCSYLRQHVKARLVLAGVDSLTAMYRSISHCDRIVEPTISGNVDQWTADELQARVEANAAIELHKQRDQMKHRIREHDGPTATDPEQVLLAASEGRIDTLFIDQDATLNGVFTPEQRTLKEVQQAPNGAPEDTSHDLIELAAVQTIKTGGTVYAVAASDMPLAKRMAAALRF